MPVLVKLKTRNRIFVLRNLGHTQQLLDRRVIDRDQATHNNYLIDRQIMTLAVRSHLPQTTTSNTNCVFNAKSLKDILAHAKIPSLINIIISEDTWTIIKVKSSENVPDIAGVIDDNVAIESFREMSAKSC